MTSKSAGVFSVVAPMPKTVSTLEDLPVMHEFPMFRQTGREPTRIGLYYPATLNFHSPNDVTAVLFLLGKTPDNQSVYATSRIIHNESGDTVLGNDTRIIPISDIEYYEFLGSKW